MSTGMWIPKSDQECKVERRARRLKGCAVALTVAFLVCAVWVVHFGFNVPIAWRIAGAVASGILLLAWQRRRLWRQFRSNVRVCEQCNVVKTGRIHDIVLCDCGGKWVPLDQMKWVERPATRSDFPTVGGNEVR